MESLGKDRASSDSPLPPSAACKEYAVPGNENIPNLSFWREESMIFATKSFSEKNS